MLSDGKPAAEVVDLFDWVRIGPGEIAEYRMPPAGVQALTVAANGQVERHIEGDFVYVPHRDLHEERDEGQAAVDALRDAVHDRAWRLLTAAASLHPQERGTPAGLREAMRQAFARTYGVGPDSIRMKTWERDGVLVGVCLPPYGVPPAVITVHDDGPTLLHTPHQRPVCFIDVGMAVLDHRAVLAGDITGGEGGQP